MMRGTFANIRLRNQLAPGTEGGWTTYQPDGEVMTIYDAAMKYKARRRAARHPGRQGIRIGLVARLGGEGHAAARRAAVIAESFERIHRSNLVNMGVLPLQFHAGATAASLGLTGRERFEIVGIADGLRPGGLVTVRAIGEHGSIEFQAVVRIDTPEELVAFRHGGILPYVLRQLVGERS